MSTEFFRKYADLIAEAESSNISPKDDADMPPIKSPPDIQEPEMRIDQFELGPPVDPFKYPKPKSEPDSDDPNADIANMTDEEKLAEIERIEKELKYITPVDTPIDAGNGDKIIRRVSPRDIEKIEKGINLNPEIQRMPWTGNSGAKRQDLDAGNDSLPLPKPSGVRT